MNLMIREYYGKVTRVCKRVTGRGIIARQRDVTGRSGSYLLDNFGRDHLGKRDPATLFYSGTSCSAGTGAGDWSLGASGVGELEGFADGCFWPVLTLAA
jgi:hypothetical protein